MNQKEFDYDNPGTLYKNEKQEYFLKPDQFAAHHIDGMVINLFTGQILHYSRAGNLIPVYGSEIMW